MCVHNQSAESRETLAEVSSPLPHASYRSNPGCQASVRLTSNPLS